MQIKIYSSYRPQHQKLYEDILALTSSLKETYPNYTDWYQKVFLPGLKKGERMYIIAKEKEQLAGCALIKKTNEERKICTLFVAPEFRKQGVAKCLIKAAVNKLGKQPLITVSSKNITPLKPLLGKMGFHLSRTKKSAYNPKDTEFYFNDEKSEAIQQKLIPLLINRAKQLSK
ncbi:MAG: GNAT family N-acetyltransferase [Alphaproteobacteria bacterium]